MLRLLVIAATLTVTSTLSAGPVEVRELANFGAVERVIKTSPAPIRVVNLWATWCGPCVAEMPDLEKLSERFPHIALIGVSLDDAIPGTRAEMKTKVAQFLRERHVRFTNFYFTGRQVELTDGFNFDGELPVTLVYGSDGNELTRVVGRLNYDSFARTIAALDKKRR